MKKLLSLVLVAVLTLSLATAAFAEPKYVTSIFVKPEDQPKDEAYWDKLYNAGRELTAEEFDPSVVAPPPPGYTPATEEDKDRWKEQAQQRLEEEKENNRIDMSLESEQRGKMMGLVFGDKVNGIPDVPESTFTGDYQQFQGADGSITKLYADGSMKTEHPDGTKEGIDSVGNRAVEDRDGNQTVYFMDGSVAHYPKSGDVKIEQADGSTVTVREDGSYSWTNDSGLVVDYDENGERTAVGFEGGDKVDLVYGQFPPGDRKITGPNGAYIEWHNGETAELSEDGMNVVTGDGGYGFTIRGVNGATGKLDTGYETKTETDEEATIAAKKATNGDAAAVTYTTNSDRINISTMAGGAVNITISRDSRGEEHDTFTLEYETPDGDIYTETSQGHDGDSFQKTFRSADGSVGFEVAVDGPVWAVTTKDQDGNITGESNVTELDDGTKIIDLGDDGTITVRPDGAVIRENGDSRLVLDAAGRPVSLTAPDVSIEWDENGNIKEANLPLGDGIRLNVDGENVSVTDKHGDTVEVTTNPDGSMTATFPDGSVLTKQPDGNWLRDGEEIAATENPEPEKTEPEKTEPEAVWVEPYSYFGVNDIAELYPHLREVHPLKIEVTPVCYDNNTKEPREFEGGGTFVIDMTEGATTTYSATIPYSMTYYTVTLTFTGAPDLDSGMMGDLMTVSSNHAEYWSSDGALSDSGTIDQCNIFNRNVDTLPDLAKRAIDIDNGTGATIAFVVDRIQIMQ